VRHSVFIKEQQAGHKDPVSGIASHVRTMGQKGP
jgi:hypothetical protein